MKPETSGPWRKAQRKATRGIDRGRRTTHKVLTQMPRRNSTWARRHGWVEPA
jgi:hypothetical protein